MCVQKEEILYTFGGYGMHARRVLRDDCLLSSLPHLPNPIYPNCVPPARFTYDYDINLGRRESW